MVANQPLRLLQLLVALLCVLSCTKPHPAHANWSLKLSRSALAQAGPELPGVKVFTDVVRDAEQHQSKNEAAATEEKPPRRLMNPFTVDNLLQWAIDHGPRVIGILLGTLVLYLLLQRASRHLVQIIARRGSRGTLNERENRAITLVGVFQNVVTLVVIGGGALMLLDELGVPILPLMGGAAVLGLAVAFGSQNLIKDYFSGFMVLLEDQYGIGDVVRIGSISGAVEQITLRITVLRDIEGILHFIPNGTITTVSNMTHGWSRALLEIGVAYKEDTDRVMEQMLDVARQLRADPNFSQWILDDAEMLGVDTLGDSAVLIKMVIKTHPLKRWPVKREYLRRIKHRFDQAGIEIPFPHRTVYLRQDGTEELASKSVRREKS